MRHIFAVLILTACSGTSIPTASNNYTWTKGVRDVWSGPAYSFDYRWFVKNNDVKFTYPDGSICQTTLNSSGTFSVGTFQITVSGYLSGGSGDPGCASLIDTYSYKNSTGFDLEICNSSAACAVYR